MRVELHSMAKLGTSPLQFLISRGKLDGNLGYPRNVPLQQNAPLYMLMVGENRKDTPVVSALMRSGLFGVTFWGAPSGFHKDCCAIHAFRLHLVRAGLASHLRSEEAMAFLEGLTSFDNEGMVLQK